MQGNYLSTQEGRKLPIPHCIQNTDRWNIVPELAEMAEQKGIVFTKETFGSRTIAEYIKEHDYEDNKVMSDKHIIIS